MKRSSKRQNEKKMMNIYIYKSKIPSLKIYYYFKMKLKKNNTINIHSAFVAIRSFVNVLWTTNLDET
jgi:hypothetical protein